MHERRSCVDKERMQRNNLLRKLLVAETEQKRPLIKSGTRNIPEHEKKNLKNKIQK